MLNESQQKKALYFLSFFSILILLMWIADFRQAVNGPFEYSGEEFVDNTKILLNNNSVIQTQDNDLKNKDTDKDGLFDWDEINIYQTSPYLEDTDSDGILDGQEVKTGGNPNCPAGSICAGQPLYAEEQAPAEQLNINTKINNNAIAPSLGAISGNSDLSSILSGQTDAKALRQALLSFGMDPAILNQIGDAELMQSYKESLNSNGN